MNLTNLLKEKDLQTGSEGKAQLYDVYNRHI